MHIPVVVAWILTVLFAALSVPGLARLARGRSGAVRPDRAVVDGQPELDPSQPIPDDCQADLAEVLMVVAMGAMVSPIGGPIPAAGWQAVFALVAAWFAVTAVRGRRSGAAHHAICAAAMLYMLTAMPGHATGHGPWLTMSRMPGRLAVPALAIIAVGYFAVDAMLSGRSTIRVARAGSMRELLMARSSSRTVQGAAMVYLFLAALTQG